MNRITRLLLGPEMVLSAFSVAVFLFCSRHRSYGSDDVSALEILLLLLPFIAVPLAFATIYVPGAKTWIWLGRVNLALMATLTLCGYRIVMGFGAPGSGPRGQDVGLLLVLSLGIAFSSLANAITGAMILRAQKPAAAEWFRTHGRHPVYAKNQDLPLPEGPLTVIVPDAARRRLPLLG